jgi:hypothetical protein
MICNVPLNDKLAAVDPTSANAGLTWANYLKTWTAWNHVRAVAALAAALSTVGLCRASSPFDLTRSKTSSPPMSTILPHKPEDWPRVFEQHFDAGDLDAVMALYDPEARFVTRSGVGYRQNVADPKTSLVAFGNASSGIKK